MNRPAATPTVLPNAVVAKFDSTVHQKQTGRGVRGVRGD